MKSLAPYWVVGVVPERVSEPKGRGKMWGDTPSIKRGSVKITLILLGLVWFLLKVWIEAKQSKAKPVRTW